MLWESNERLQWVTLPDEIDVYVYPGAWVCLEKEDDEGEMMIIPIRPEHIPILIEVLKQALKRVTE